MAKGTRVNYDEVRKKALHTAALLFLSNGYTSTPIRMIAKEAGVGLTSMLRVFSSKEGILCELVKFVLEGQFSTAQKMLAGMTDDPVLYYATETTLQLYMAESDEAVRDLYSAAYSSPDSAELIYRTVSRRLLQAVFHDYLPEQREEDFYHLEIASGSIIRGYMTVPCTPDFPMEEKVRYFLENSLKIYNVPPEKREEANDFVKRFDYSAIARQTIENMFVQLETALNKNEVTTVFNEGYPSS